jgi:methylglutaconyl-CoA hydratase
MADPLVLSAIDERGVATITLNRPEVHNAYNGAMIDGLIEAVEALAADRRVRVLVLRANGRHFQAGADPAPLRRHRRALRCRPGAADRARARSVRR